MDQGEKFCGQCASQVSLTARFCAKCGRPFEAGDAAGRENAAAQDPANAIVWDIAYPLLTNRFFLYDMIKMLFWTFLIFNGLILSIFLFEGNFASVVPFLGLSGLILLGFICAIVGITALIFGNRFPTRFRISSNGIFYQSLSGRASTINRAAIVIGLLARKPGAAGAGLIAASQERGGIPWEHVRRVREYPAQRVISIMNSWHVVVRLYCNPENYTRVLELVRTHAAAGAAKRADPKKS
jgi:hypothetical protein